MAKESEAQVEQVSEAKIVISLDSPGETSEQHALDPQVDRTCGSVGFDVHQLPQECLLSC